MSKNYLIIFQNAPYNSYHGQENLDLALTCASLERNISFLFLWDGIYHLVQSQDPNTILRKTFTQAFRALDLYEIQHAYVDEASFRDRGLSPQDLIIPVKLLNALDLRRLFLTHDITWRR